MNKCDNCGASYDEGLPKCPYCGAIEPNAAEAEYMDKLKNVKANLNRVDDMAVADFKAEFFQFLKAFLIAAAIASTIGVSFYLAMSKANIGSKIMSRAEVDDQISDILCFREYLTEWDEMYEAGKYDELCDSLTEARKKTHFFYNNPYYYFYIPYYTMCSSEETITNEVPDNSYGLYVILYSYANAVCEYNRFAEAEYETGKEALEAKLDEIKQEMLKIPQFSEEVLEEFEKAAFDGDRVDIDSVKTFTEERWGE